MGHVRGAPLCRFRHGGQEDPRRRRGHRPWHDQWPSRLCLLQGLHRVRRFAVGDPRPEDRQDPEGRNPERRARHRYFRCRRCAYPGRRGLPGRLCRHFPAEHAGFGRGAADIHDHGPVRRRRCLFARHHRLHLHGEGHLLHVCHRPGRGEDGDQRDRHPRGAGWRFGACEEIRCRRWCVRERSRGHRADPPPGRFPAAVQPRDTAQASQL